MGINASIKGDIKSTSTELVCEEMIRLPGEVCVIPLDLVFVWKNREMKWRNEENIIRFQTVFTTPSKYTYKILKGKMLFDRFPSESSPHEHQNK